MFNNAGDVPGVIAPPPLIALATLVVGLVLDWVFPAYVLTILFSLVTRVIIGGILAALGTWMALTAERAFRELGTNVPPWKPTLALAVGGIYRRSRNPMYVGLALIVGGLGVVFGSDWTLVLLVVAALVLHYGVVLREECYLEGKFGDDYRRYKQSVPRYGWRF